MIRRICFLILLLSAIGIQQCKAQRVALRTNALEWMLASPNLALETRLSRRVTLDFSFGGSPFIHHPVLSDWKLRNMNFSPSVRYWLNRPMARNFVGVNVTAVLFDVCIKDHCWKGDVISFGLDYGYDFVLSRHWNLELTAGVGLGKVRGKDYRTFDPEPDIPNMSKWAPLPRVGVSFTYIIK